MASVDDEEKADARENFNLFDKDHDGKISLDEFRNVVMLITDGQITEERITKMLKEVDLNGDGVIDFEEFYTAVKKESTPEG